MMNIHPIFDPETATVTYIVWDKGTGNAVVIDPVLDFDPRGIRTSTGSVDKVIEFVTQRGLTVQYALETHAHADHLSACDVIKTRLGAKVGIGAGITQVQAFFGELLNLGLAADGSQFDVLLSHGQTLKLGDLTITALATPGHTPACTSYQVGNAVFTGDTLLMPKLGTGRCDFPKGSAAAQYRSVREILYGLPDETRVFVGHDYPAPGKDAEFETTIGASKKSNKMITASTTQAEFIETRRTRDATLQVPKLLFPAVQVNVNAGVLPTADSNGTRYLRLPVNVL